jgi:hypothetical protein
LLTTLDRFWISSANTARSFGGSESGRLRQHGKPWSSSANTSPLAEESPRGLREAAVIMI